jgi:hypothetical protein
VVRLDGLIYNPSSEPVNEGNNPVERQIGLLRAAFGNGR